VVIFSHEERDVHEGREVFVLFVIFVAEDRYHHVGGAFRSVLSSS